MSTWTSAARGRCRGRAWILMCVPKQSYCGLREYLGSIGGCGEDLCCGSCDVLKWSD